MINTIYLIDKLLRDENLLPATREALIQERKYILRVDPLGCPQCKKEFTPHHGRQKYCSRTCAQAAISRRHYLKKSSREHP